MTSDAVSSFDWRDNSWRSFGVSDRAVYEPGSGDPLDFGYLDAALVRILPDLLPILPIASRPNPFFDPGSGAEIGRLPGTIVTGFGIASGCCQGVIQSVVVTSTNGEFNADVVIASLTPEGITKEGDSGMMWHTPDGDLLAQHALGREEAPGRASTLTIASFAYRIRNKLGIEAFR